MAEHRPVLRTALAGRLPPVAPAAVQRQAGVTVAEWPQLGCIVLRGHAHDHAFMAAAQAVLGTTLPTRPSSLAAAGAGVVLWMSPDEWWWLLPHAARDAGLAALSAATQGVFSQLVDNSGGLACLRLAGSAHLTVLRHLSPYDFERMPAQACVSTVVPRAGLTVVRTDERGVMLIFRRSFADWIWRLVERAAEPYGLAVCTTPDLPAVHFSDLLKGTR